MSNENLELSSAMSKEELERRKLLIERRKLLVELRQLQFPWWKKPVYIGILLPTLLAFGTLSIGFFTGYFQNEHKLVELRRENAAAKERELNKSVADLTTQKGQLELDYSNKKKELEDKIKELEDKINQANKDIQKIDIDRITLMVEAQTKRQELIDKAQALDADFRKKSAAIATQLKQRQDELEATRKSLAKAEIRQKLSRKDTDVLYRTNLDLKNIPNVVLFLDKRKDASQLYLTALQEMAEEQDEFQDVFLHILYKATGNPKWKNDLFQLARKEIRISGKELEISKDIHLLGVYRMPPIFTEGSWDENDRLEIIDLMFEIMETKNIDPLNINAAFRVLDKLYDPALYAKGRDPFRHVQGYLAALKKVRDQALDKKFPESPRLGAFDFLSRLSPQCYLVAVGHEAASQGRNEDLIRLLFNDQRAKIDEYLRNYSTPPNSSDASSWKRWLESNNRIVKLCMEVDLDTLRAKPELLKAQ